MSRVYVMPCPLGKAQEYQTFNPNFSVIANVLPHANFHDFGADHHDRRINTNVKKRCHIRQLEALGFRVTLEPASAA